MTDNKTIHENSLYIVRVSEDGESYEVVHKEYGVIEYADTTLTACLYQADNLEFQFNDSIWRRHLDKEIDRTRDALGSIKKITAVN